MTVPIISVDDHVVEPPDLWQRYLPTKLREAGPRVVRMQWERGTRYRQLIQPGTSGPEADCWLFGDVPQFIGIGMVASGKPPEEIDHRPVDFSDMRSAFIDPKARLADMDVINVERSLCFPNSARFCGQVFLWMEDKEMALACVRAYNDWAIEEWSGDSNGRLIPVCLIPMWDAEAAAVEVRRNAARGARAVAFSELPAALGLPSIFNADGYWLPFFEACSETGTVVCIHIGSSSTAPVASPDAPAAVGASGTNLNAMMALSEWLFSGLLARYPTLTVALSESQIGWIPFVLERCDRLWQQGYSLMEIPAEITELPSHYFRRQIYGCFFEDDFGIQVRDQIGIDRITFECDYPHQSSTWPNTAVYFEKATMGLDENEIYKIARGNAIDMLGLPKDV